jgi:hypothetical protein
MEEIRPDDILLGRGPFCYRNPGNVAFRNLIQKYVSGYERDSPRSVKRKIVHKLILKARNAGHRFLVRSIDVDKWIEAHPYLVHTKVSHALRDARNSTSDTLVPRNSSLLKTKKSHNRIESKLKQDVPLVCPDLKQEKESIQGKINTLTQSDCQIFPFINEGPSLHQAQYQIGVNEPAWFYIPNYFNDSKTTNIGDCTQNLRYVFEVPINFIC